MSRSISTTISLVFSAVILASTALLGYLVYSESSEAFIEVSRERLLHTAGITELRLTERLNAVSNDVKFLLSNQAVQTLADAAAAAELSGVFSRSTVLDSLNRSVATESLAAVFGALLRTRPEYTQVRLIGLENDGREVLRLNRVGNTIVFTRADELQNKGDRKYFKEAIRLPAGRVYISDINLNRERGVVSTPHMPTVRVAAPVYASSGDIYGILVINVDAGQIFRDVRELTGPGISLLLANERGDYLIHPDSGRTFSLDRGWDFRIQDDYPILLDLYQGRRQTAMSEDLGGDDDRTLTYFKRVRPFPGSERFLVLAIISPYDVILRDAAAVELHGLLWTIAISLIALVLTWFFARFLMRPLDKITSAVARYNAGDAVNTLPTDRSDEFGALARAFESMSDRVRAEMRSKDEFLATMSHEIRTPMNAVVGMTHLLKRDVPAGQDSRVIDTLEFAARNLLSLINDVLDYNKLRAGALELENIDFGVHSTLEAIVASYRPAAAERGLLVQLDLAADLPPVLRGDPLRLTQIVNNLLDNAIKFTEEGEIRVSVAAEATGAGESGFGSATAQKRATEDLQDASDAVWLSIEVADSGIGIDAAHLPFIFDRFAQAGSDTARKYGGSGLGLAIVGKLVNLHGGSVNVKSEPGVGSTFNVQLPLQRGSAATAPQRPKLGTLDFNGAEILYVEDVEYNRFLLENLVSAWNVKCFTADGGIKGLERSYERVYKLILLDIQMPDMDGYAVLKALREDNANPNQDTPVAALSAIPQLSEQQSTIGGQAAGFNDVLEKPIDPELLAGLLQRWIGEHQDAAGTQAATARSVALETTATSPAEMTVLPEMFTRMYDNNTTLMRRALELLGQECHRQIPELRRFFAAGDHAAFAAAVHRLSPHLKTFGLNALLADLRKLRQALREASEGVAEDSSADALNPNHDASLQKTLTDSLEQLTLFAERLQAAQQALATED